MVACRYWEWRRDHKTALETIPSPEKKTPQKAHIATNHRIISKKTEKTHTKKTKTHKKTQQKKTDKNHKKTKKKYTTHTPPSLVPLPRKRPRTRLSAPSSSLASGKSTRSASASSHLETVREGFWFLFFYCFLCFFFFLNHDHHPKCAILADVFSQTRTKTGAAGGFAPRKALRDGFLRKALQQLQRVPTGQSEETMFVGKRSEAVGFKASTLKTSFWCCFLQADTLWCLSSDIFLKGITQFFSFESLGPPASEGFFVSGLVFQSRKSFFRTLNSLHNVRSFRLGPNLLSTPRCFLDFDLDIS